jgi:CTP:molybdopterin cytidylyltransferase MocA
MKCGALILAAGASTRLGDLKQLARLGDETLLDRSIRIAREAGCAPIVVILGASEERIRSECKLPDVSLLSNPDWQQGMGRSISFGVGESGNVPGVLVMTCDMPAVTAEHLRALAASGTMSASSYAGRKGVPAYFPREMFPELLKLQGDAGARELLRSANAIKLTGGELDVDTPEDLEQARKKFAESRVIR